MVRWRKRVSGRRGGEEGAACGRARRSDAGTTRTRSSGSRAPGIGRCGRPGGPCAPQSRARGRPPSCRRTRRGAVGQGRYAEGETGAGLVSRRAERRIQGWGEGWKADARASRRRPRSSRAGGRSCGSRSLGRRQRASGVSEGRARGPARRERGPQQLSLSDFLRSGASAENLSSPWRVTAAAIEGRRERRGQFRAQRSRVAQPARLDEDRARRTLSSTTARYSWWASVGVEWGTTVGARSAQGYRGAAGYSLSGPVMVVRAVGVVGLGVGVGSRWRGRRLGQAGRRLLAGRALGLASHPPPSPGVCPGDRRATERLVDDADRPSLPHAAGRPSLREGPRRTCPPPSARPRDEQSKRYGA